MAREKDGDGGTAFERDFGYLMPFLDKVAAAARSLAPAPQRELLALLAGEKERWGRIQALLAGRAAPSAPAARAQDHVREESGRKPAPVGGEEAPVTRFTVGSLRGRAG